MVSSRDVTEALRRVVDPELHKDVVSLGMIQDLLVEGNRVSFTLNLTTPACPLRSEMERSVREAASSVKGVDRVEMKVAAEVTATRTTEQSGPLKGVKNIVAVASGKGGVGKSTVACNLALALSASGARVGLLDADIYGPSIPLMMGAKERPQVRDETIIPPVSHGVKIVSLGFFYKDETPLVWRGPMVAGAVKQLLTQVEWGDLDYLICDLPPGCLPAGTLVLTANNVPKPIEEVRVGEFIMSYDGERLVPRRVLGVVPQGKQRVFKLKTPDRTIFASANHPFLRYDRAASWCRLENLEPRDRIVVSQCVHGGQRLSLPEIVRDEQGITLPNATNADFMRVVGHFVGAGFVRAQKGRRSAAGLGISEPKSSRFRETYEDLYKKVFSCKILDENRGMRFDIASVPLARLFTALDLNQKAMKKRVPHWAFGLPLDQRLAFIQGYAEADGTIREREAEKNLPDGSGLLRAVKTVQGTVEVSTTNRLLALDIHELCLMSGLRASSVRMRTMEDQSLPEERALNGGVTFDFEFSLKVDTRPFKLARIEEISPAGEMETYDLQVDQYQNFVANSIVVHNTGDASLTLAQTVPLSGVVIVTTPQEAALNTATKALAMFRKLNVPILGIVENMSYFVCPHCGERTHIFSAGGGSRASSQLNVQFLGEIPLSSRVREQSDLGTPILASDPDSPESATFKDIAYRVAGMLSIVAYEQKGQQG